MEPEENKISPDEIREEASLEPEELTQREPVPEESEKDEEYPPDFVDSNRPKEEENTDNLQLSSAERANEDLEENSQKSQEEKTPIKQTPKERQDSSLPISARSERSEKLQDLEAELKKYKDILSAKEQEIEELKEILLEKDRQIENMKMPKQAVKATDLSRSRAEIPKNEIDFWQVSKNENRGQNVDSLSSIKNLWITSLDKKPHVPVRGHFKQNALARIVPQKQNEILHKRLKHLRQSSESSLKNIRKFSQEKKIVK